jgi:hypothetical protein
MNVSQWQWLIGALLIFLFGLFPLFSIIIGVGVSLKKSTKFDSALALHRTNKFMFVLGALSVIGFVYACLMSFPFFREGWIIIVGLIAVLYGLTQKTIHKMAYLQVINEKKIVNAKENKRPTPQDNDEIKGYKETVSKNRDQTTIIHSETVNMRTFRRDQNDFEIDIPEDWSPSEITPLAQQHGGSNWQMSFSGPAAEEFHILAGPLSPTEAEPTLKETEHYFRNYAFRLGYKILESGIIRVGNKDHFWGKYFMRANELLVLVKKYSLIFNRVEYVITCRLGVGYDNELVGDEEAKKKEHRYDEIVSTFRLVHS